jgi:hypothetical protein
MNVDGQTISLQLPAQRLPQPREFVPAAPRSTDSGIAVVFAGMSIMLSACFLVSALLESAPWTVALVGVAGFCGAARVEFTAEARALQWVTRSMATCLVVIGTIAYAVQLLA